MTQSIKSIAKKTIYLVNKLPFRQNSYLKEIQKRSKLPLTDIYGLSKNISILSAYTNELQVSNDWYGHATVLKDFLGLQRNYQFKFVIEHGVVFSSQVNKIEMENKLNSMVTMSRQREIFLKKIKSNAFSIGPYIHYAKHLETGLKQKNNVLVVFPSHSTLQVQMHINHLQFIKEIKKLAKNFSKVQVCLYWKDILNGIAKLYLENGFECVTAGHIFDPLFLPRLKTIILGAKLTVSDDAGTHVGYSIALDKPHLIIPVDHRLSGDSNEVKVSKSTVYSKHYQEVIRTFSKITSKITKSQYDIIDKYWGLKEIKTKQQLQKIADETNHLYQKNEH